MFSSLKCAGLKFKWQSDRLCVGSIGWVRNITPGWQAELSDDRSCPTWNHAAVTREVKRRTADLQLGTTAPTWREVESKQENSGRCQGNGSGRGMETWKVSLKLWHGLHVLKGSSADQVNFTPLMDTQSKVQPLSSLSGPWELGTVFPFSSGTHLWMKGRVGHNLGVSAICQQTYVQVVRCHYCSQILASLSATPHRSTYMGAPFPTSKHTCLTTEL